MQEVPEAAHADITPGPMEPAIDVSGEQERQGEGQGQGQPPHAARAAAGAPQHHEVRPSRAPPQAQELPCKGSAEGGPR
eukprot:2003578-Alexandrium_andersonii.AAC.1